MAFDSKHEYVDLIQQLASTRITREVQTDHVAFGGTKVQFYGSEAVVADIRPVTTALKILSKQSLIRRWLAAIGIHSHDAETRRALRHSGVFTTHQGHPATEIHSQELTLRLPDGMEVTFDVRGVGSRGLHHLRNGDRITAIFASTGSDLVPFVIRCGYQWHLLWNGILDRLADARVWGLEQLEVRLKGHAGYIVDTLSR